ncbi:MAG: protein-tyrosine-phosphatase [Alphaproteobacteria bacterium]|nr:protein-tyrosine-phosphatase [Alphaproteobacteria bacterium]MCB9797260.1 protein-tyrosine-phosphatase [Alphaproteobacteria bacterium]
MIPALLLLLACAPKAPPPEEPLAQDPVSVDASANEVPAMQSPLHPALAARLDAWIAEGPPETLDAERLASVEELAAWIAAREAAPMIFVCTHNSRRSHIAALWARAAALHLGLDGVQGSSGGTEATAFNPRAVAAMQALGFEITESGEVLGAQNLVYEVSMGPELPPERAWSKVFSDPANPQEGFAAVMVCSAADAACPYVEGADLRIALPYLDPKVSDGTPEEAASYRAKGEEIGREMAWMMHLAAAGRGAE